MTMKKTLLLMLMAVLCSVLVSATAANVKFTLPSPIVKDVPFYADLEMASQNEDVARIQLYVTSTGKNVDFLSSSLGIVWLSTSTVNQNEQLDSGKVWKYNVGPKGAVNDKTTSGTFKRVITIRAQTRVDDTLALTTTTPPDNIIAHYPDGASLGINLATSAMATVSSTCGDGVVGYLDGNTLGIKDGNDANEACDEGKDGSENNKNAAVGGCSADCKYIELGYSCTNTGFGERNSVCSPLPAADFFLAKMTVLLKTKTCYPTNDHPAKLYGFFCDADPDNNNLGKGQLIGLVGKALFEYTTAVFTTG